MAVCAHCGEPKFASFPCANCKSRENLLPGRTVTRQPRRETTVDDLKKGTERVEKRTKRIKPKKKKKRKIAPAVRKRVYEPVKRPDGAPPMTVAERVALWRQRDPERARKVQRDYMRRMREKEKAKKLAEEAKRQKKETV